MDCRVFIESIEDNSGIFLLPDGKKRDSFVDNCVLPAMKRVVPKAIISIEAEIR